MFLCIVGTSRCGTTILRELLHAHPELKIFRETHWIPKMVEFYGHQRVPMRDLLDIVEKTTWDTGRDLLSVNLEFSPFESREELDLALHAEFARFGARFDIREFHAILARVLFDHNGLWGDKTPDYGYHMTTIQALWPECRFIHIVRDGLATAQSMSRHPACQLMISGGYDNWCSLSYDGLYKRYKIENLPMKSYIQSWRRRLTRIRDEACRLMWGNYLEVRYEELLNNSDSVLRKICSFLGLDADSSWVSSCAAKVQTQRSLPEFELPILGNLDPEDLRALFASRGNPLGIEKALLSENDLTVLLGQGWEALRNGDADHAARCGLVLCGDPFGERHPQIVADAAELVRESFLILNRS